MQIEPYKPDYVDAVVRLSLRAWAPVFDSLKQAMQPYVYEAFYPQGWRASQDKAVRDVCASADMKVWVAIESGTVAGFFAVRYHAADKLGEIYMIAVDPDFQRRGIALAMTDFAVERMKEAAWRSQWSTPAAILGTARHARRTRRLDSGYCLSPATSRNCRTRA